MEGILNNNRLLKSDRLCKAITGLIGRELLELLPTFEQCLIQRQYEIRPRELRLRKLGAGKKGALPTGLDKLVFILMYLKVYPTYDLLGFLTNRVRSKCHRSVHQLLPVLGLALDRKLVLPERKVTSVEEFYRLFPEAKDVFLDGTERPVQKPRNPKRKKKLYSGKKKQTTRKTIVLSDEYKRILVLTPTKSGRRHDKRLADKAQLIENIPPDVTVWNDTGFQGIQKIHANVVMPKKSTKKYPLNEEEKENNKIISSIRVVSEHAIGGMKRMKAAADIYRNKLANLDDTFSLLAAGIWNFHLEQAK
jgi:hypothetical protein